MTAARRRWTFTLRTLFVVVAICGTAGYWLACHVACQRAQRNYELVYSYWQAELVPAVNLCEESRRLCWAEARVPFADRHRAAAEHLERMENVWLSAYGLASEWMMGVRDDADLAGTKKRRSEIERCYHEAQRLAAER